MKLNKKGFMLAEVVIVASVISALLITLYISLNRISAAYELRNKYYDIDAIYAAMEVNNVLDRTNFFETKGLNTNYELLTASGYDVEITKLANYYSTNTKYNLKAHYIVSNIDTLKELISNTSEGYFKDYLEYLEDNIIFSDYNYLIIVELENKNDLDDVYFYTLKVKGDTSEAE